VLAERLAARASESAEAQRARLAKATEELDAANRSGVYNYRVVNDDLASAVEAMIAIFQKELPVA
jgi:guanylate kinase